ncbi:hypothetical protein MVEN_00197100 [Mycena venus]|uniref:Uncharacterized protein n=1 Tax=Mycena venus TaxID=2733690 RepID=A0A8H7DAV9_9AGAR|nr:hypothetical protein MVEN_00197100 [Mycena venus]
MSNIKGTQTELRSPNPQICATPLTHFVSSLLFWTLSFIPSNPFRYIALGIALVSFLVYGALYNTPSARLGRLDNAIATVNSILMCAKAKCIRDHLLLAEIEVQFLQTKLWASKIHTRVLEMCDMPWTIYLQNIPSVLKSLANCERELCELKTSMLLLIEVAHQHELAQDINESREVVDGVALASIVVFQCLNVKFEPTAGEESINFASAISGLKYNIYDSTPGGL